MLIGAAVGAGFLLIGGLVWLYYLGASLWPAVLLALLALWFYRRFKNRTSRLTRRFAAKVSKLPEVLYYSLPRN